MKKIFYLFLGLIALLQHDSIYAQAPNYIWAQKSGSVNGISISAVAVDASGNSYITGTFRSTVTIGGTLLDAGGGSGMFLVKYNANGTVVWAKKAVGNDSILPQAIAVDANGDIYVGGGFYATTFTMNSVTLTNSDASTTFTDDFVLKFNSSGTALWGNKYFSNNFGNDYVFDLAVDPSGNVVLAGGNHDTVTNSRNIIIEKISSTGFFMWYKSISGTVTDQADNVSVDTNGYVYVSGKSNSPSLTIGSTTYTNAGGYDMFLIKYDNAGNLIWSKSIANVNDISPLGMNVDNSGNLYLNGYFNSPNIAFGANTLTNPGTGLYSYFLVKYDSNGNLLWAIKPNGGNTTANGELAVDGFGNCFFIGRYTANFVIGSTNFTNAGGQDIFVAHYNSSGTFVWAKTIGSTLDDYSAEIALGPNGNCHVTGNFLSDSLTFGTTVLTNQGNDPSFTEYFLTKLDNTNLAINPFAQDSSVFKLYPNPVQNHFELSSDLTIEKVEVYSMLGQLVKSFPMQNQYEVSDLKKGSYLVKVTSGETSESKIILID